MFNMTVILRPKDGQNGHEGTPSLIAKPKTTQGSKKSELVRGVGRWHAVSIQCQGSSCQVALGLKNARFLSAEAPTLPLPQCPKKDLCRCLYKHHEDRRGQLRRREEITGLRSKVRVAEERRVERDRRRNDTF